MRIIATIVLMIISLAGIAQKQVGKSDSLVAALDTLKTPTLKFSKADTAKAKLDAKLDSLARIKAQVKNKVDSLNPLHAIKSKQQKLDSVKSAWLSKTNVPDSLNATNKLKQYNSKLDSARTHLQARIDSLSHLKLDLGMIKGMDSLKLKLDSLKSNGALKDVQQAEAKLAELQQKVGGKVTEVEKQLNEKLGALSQQGISTPTLNLPGTAGKLNMPTLNTALPSGINLAGADLKLPTGNLPASDLSLKTNPDLNLKNLGEKTNIGELPDLKTNPIKEMDGLKDLQKDFAKVGELGSEIKGYQSDIEKVREGGLDELEQLPEKAEEKALELAGDDFEQRAAMVEKWKSNPAYAKELALNEAKEQAVNHFAGKEEQLKTAMEQLGKLKGKYADAESVLDLFKKKQRPLKNKPFVERLVPGVAFQMQFSKNFWLDINPSMGYQISRRFTGGVGWNERLSFNFKELEFISSERIFGPRSFLEFKFKENITFKVESEVMRAWVLTPQQVYRNESPTREWVWSSFAGMKNVFKLSKHMKGNVQVLYNLYNPDKRSPYLDRINLRFGFEYVIKKKSKY
jgi:hypothetical protein